MFSYIFPKYANGEGGFIEFRAVNKIFTLEDDVVNQNLVVDRVNHSKENILDIKRNGNKLL